MKIERFDSAGSHRTGEIDGRYTVEEINTILGFAPNVDDDPDKVKHSWGFKVNGKECGIWDYYGHRWSTYGPQVVFDELFPPKG